MFAHEQANMLVLPRHMDGHLHSYVLHMLRSEMFEPQWCDHNPDEQTVRK